MASVYTTEQAATSRISAKRLRFLLDRTDSGSATPGVMDAAISRAGRIIDRALKQRYGSAIPFAQITDSPETPTAIQEIANDLVLFDLYSFHEPGGRDAEYHRALAFEALEALKNGDEDVPVARAKAHEGKHIAVYSAPTSPTFSGVDRNDKSRMRGI